MNTHELASRLNESFKVCTYDQDSNVVRCEHRYKDAVRSVYFFQAVEVLPSDDELLQFQEIVVAPSYFKASDDSRWNHFVVFVTGNQASSSESYLVRKGRIESEKSYARKLVIKDKDLGGFLSRSAVQVRPASRANEMLSVWTHALTNAGLYEIATRNARAEVLRNIQAGRTAPIDPSPVVNNSRPQGEPPITLSKLTIRKFGDRALKGEFELGAVNLIRGPNGVGKTSFLEAIEQFFCGATFRNDGEVETFDASVTFSNGKISRYSEAQNAEYQRRDLAWYGRTTNKGNKLCEGFARYQYLNTDAAAELSRDSKLRDIRDALGKIALGPDASYTWNRILQFETDISKAIGPLNRRLMDLGQRVKSAQDRLGALKTPSPQVVVQRASLDNKLDELAWPLELRPSTQMSLEDFGVFQPLTQICVHATPESPGELDVIDQKIRGNSEDAERASRIDAAQQANRNERSQVSDALKSLNARIEKINRLIQYAKAGFCGRYLRLGQTQGALATLSGLKVDTGDLDKLVEQIARRNLGHLPLSAAIEAMRNVLEQKRELQKSQLEVQARERSVREERDRLIDEMRNLARQLASHHSDIDSCPVCRTAMSGEEFLRRISTSSAIIATLPTGLAGTTTTLQWEIQDTVEGLRILQTIALIDAKGLNKTCDEAIKDLLDLVARRTIVETDARELEQEISQLRVDGFSKEEYDSLIQVFLPGRSVDGLDDGELFDLMVAEAGNDANKVGGVVTRLEELGTERDGYVREIDVLAKKHSLPAVARAISTTLLERNAAIRAFSDALNSLPNSVLNKFHSDLRELINRASIVNAELNAVSDQIRQEQAKEAEIKVLEATLVRDQLAASNLNTEVENLSRAQSTLQELMRDHSFESGLSEFLLANQTVIQDIFSRIHVPNELKLSTLADCTLERIGTNASATLTQISTGQRAALMLSVFLTLNLSLQAGPPLMLVDDPVAHIDDLNTLALLDYLADVAEAGSRQIFFATANEKLANLFAKKMSFLGKKEFREIDLSLLNRQSDAPKMH